MQSIVLMDEWIDGWMPNSSNSISARMATFTRPTKKEGRKQTDAADRQTTQREARSGQKRQMSRERERDEQSLWAGGLAGIRAYVTVPHCVDLSIITLYLPSNKLMAVRAIGWMGVLVPAADPSMGSMGWVDE
mmetsp:Transcript_26244/g.65236  ORF Transcript_26244/g.65236 Transcript_26244/m.65236 type:complete len:133 (-) Transcript_26244:265-663(-)